MKIRLAALTIATVVLAGCHQATDPVTDQLDGLFSRFHDNDLFRGAVVVSDRGDVVYQAARGLASEEWQVPNTVATRYRIASLSKQFTAVVVLQLVDQGVIGLDDEVASVLSGLPEAWSTRVTVRHLLNQTSGIPDYTLLPDYLESVSKQRFTRQDFLKLLQEEPLFDSPHFTPGTEWEYSNTNYFLLGVIAETAAATPFEDLLQNGIFNPLGMSDSGVFDSLVPVAGLAEGYEINYSGGVERAAHSEFSPKSVPSGGLYSSAPDLVRWSAALRDGRFLSEGALEVFSTPPFLDDDGAGYACGQWRELRRRPDGRQVEIFSHGGSIMGMSTYLLREPTTERSVVLLNNGGGARETMFEQLSLAILDILDGGEGAMPRLDLIAPLASTYFNHREHLVEHYQLLKERHGDVYDFGPEQLSLIGRLLLDRVGDRETAEVLFRLNVEENSQSSLAHRDLGALLLEDGSQDDALFHLQRALDLADGPDPELEALIARAH